MSVTNDMAAVLTKHWSRSTFTNHNPHVDKCDGCGAVIYIWGDDPIPGGIEPLAAHQAAALSAAGFGPIKEAKVEALEEAADEAEGTIAAGDIAECAAPVEGESGRHEAVADRDWLYEEPHNWLRARAAVVEVES